MSNNLVNIVGVPGGVAKISMALTLNFQKIYASLRSRGYYQHNPHPISTNLWAESPPHSRYCESRCAASCACSWRPTMSPKVFGNIASRRPTGHRQKMPTTPLPEGVYEFFNFQLGTNENSISFSHMQVRCFRCFRCLCFKKHKNSQQQY